MNSLIYGLVILFTTVYVAESQHILEVLTHRAEQLIRSARIEVERLQGLGKGHLLAELEQEIKKVEQLEEELKSLSFEIDLNPNYVRSVEEQLLKHENRLAEELSRINSHEVIPEPEPKPQHILEVLTHRAEQLIRSARLDVERLQGLGKGHLLAELEQEIKKVEQLEEELKSLSFEIDLNPDYVSSVEEQILKHENRLAEELSRINSHEVIPEPEPKPQHILEVLTHRAEQLIRSARIEVERLQGLGKGHLLAELEQEIKKVEQLEEELKSLSFEINLNPQYVYNVEEQLLKHENRLAEELSRINSHEVIPEPEPEPVFNQREHVLEKARALLQRAKHELTILNPKHQLVPEIEYEIKLIQEFIYELEMIEESILEEEHYRQVEERLANHEIRLYNILGRAKEV